MTFTICQGVFEKTSRISGQAAKACLLTPFLRKRRRKADAFSRKGGLRVDRTILHCDINNCFASIEAVLDPSLKGLPIAVCGSKEDRHGIVLAKSEEAKRYGVATAEAIWQAQKKCPQLVIVSPHYGEYARFSRAARELYAEYTDLVEPFGMDECWLDVSASRLLFGDGRAIADELRRRMREEVGLTISVGVSFNKIFAKLGSDMKKPDATTEIGRDFREKIWPLPAADLFGVGRSSRAQLERYCIHTIGDLARTNPDFLQRAFGKAGLTLWQYANGLDLSPVMPIGYVSPIKSVGHGQTPPADMKDNAEVRLMLLHLAQDVGRRLRQNGLAARGVSVRVRDGMLAFRQYQTATRYPTSCACELAEAGFRLFRERYDWRCPVRAVTLTAINLCDEKFPAQLDFGGGFRRHERAETLERAADGVRSRFGKGAITPASLLLRKKSEYIPPAFADPLRHIETHLDI